jgi:hypothetical protein
MWLSDAKKRVVELILTHYDAAKLVFVVLRCNSNVVPTVLVTFGRHDSSSSAFAAVIATYRRGLRLRGGPSY